MARLGSVLLSIAAVLGLGLAAAMWNQIYGIGGWRDEVEAVAGELAVREASEDFSKGRLRIYEFTEESSGSNRSTGRSLEGFEVWSLRFHPALGRAHTGSTKAFVEDYNRIMRRLKLRAEKDNLGSRK